MFEILVLQSEQQTQPNKGGLDRKPILGPFPSEAHLQHRCLCFSVTDAKADPRHSCLPFIKEVVRVTPRVEISQAWATKSSVQRLRREQVRQIPRLMSSVALSSNAFLQRHRFLIDGRNSIIPLQISCVHVAFCDQSSSKTYFRLQNSN